MIRLLNSSFEVALRELQPHTMAFADPPDALGLKYNGFKDKFSDGEYRDLMYRLIYNGTQICKIMWLSFNAKYTFLVGGLIDDFLQAHGGWEAKACQQVFTFGQHNHNDLGNNHRPLYRLKREDAPIYPDAIRVPSWRQLNGDKRADPRGRVPGDVFEFHRVTGNSKQRRAFSPTQLHEGLYERCIKLSCKPGDTVLDLFAGSGTLGRVAPRCGITTATMVEISPEVCEAIAADQNMLRVDACRWAKEVVPSLNTEAPNERLVGHCD